MDWDTYFMNMVYLVAAKSKDPSTHIGAAIVTPDNQVVSTGYNGYPRGVPYVDPSREERPEKYFWYEHGERNAIYHAARHGICTRNCKIYTNGIPCADCGRAIIQAGISEVITDRQWDDTSSHKWSEHAERTLIMFKETGVKWRQWEGELITLERFLRRC